MENKILNELAGYISDMSAKLTQIQKCINVLANARNETVPSTTDAESDPDKSESSIYDWDSEMIRIAKTPNSNGYIYNLLFLTMLEDNLKRGANPDGLKEFYRKNMEDSSWVEEFIDKWVTLHAHKNTESPLDTNSTEDSECEKCTEDDGDFEAFMADIFGYQTTFNYAYLCINGYLLLVQIFVGHNVVAYIAIIKEKLVSIFNHQIHFPHQIRLILNVHWLTVVFTSGFLTTKNKI